MNIINIEQRVWLMYSALMQGRSHTITLLSKNSWLGRSLETIYLLVNCLKLFVFNINCEGVSYFLERKGEKLLMGRLPR